LYHQQFVKEICIHSNLNDYAYRFIYTGRISYDSCKEIDWISLLNGAKKLELYDLLTETQNYLINEQKEWVQQNTITISNFAASTVSLNKLLDYCNQVMALHPDIIFGVDNIATVPKETLITILKRDDLDMEEGDIWISVVHWAMKQVPGLVNDPYSWSSNDIHAIKGVIVDFMPHVRFLNISQDDFNEKVIPYDELLPTELRHDVLYYYMKKDYEPKPQSYHQELDKNMMIHLSLTTNKQNGFH